MIYSINYEDMSEQINPFAFVKYLYGTGWVEVKRKNPSIKLYQLEKNKELFQITVPIDRNLNDYKYAMFRAVEILAAAEQKSLEKVLLYLLNPNTDIIKIRFDNKKVEAGNIMLDDAIKLFENAKKLVAATALDIINPSKFHYGRIDDAVLRFMSSCRFGQTEIGRYIVSVVCPFAEIDENDEYQQLTFFSDEEKCANSLTRKVTTKMFENINTIKSKVDSGKYMDLTEQFEDYKISANFLEALNGISVNSENDLVEFSAEWSPVVKQRQNLQSIISLNRDYCQPIATVITKLKGTPKTYQEVVGRVSKLSSIPAADKRQTGEVTISYIDENNKSRKLITTLDKVDYDKSIEAHQLGKFVKAVGEISQKGSRFYLKCQSFNLID